MSGTPGRSDAEGYDIPISKQLRYLVSLLLVVIAAARTALAEPVTVELAERPTADLVQGQDPGDPTTTGLPTTTTTTTTTSTTTTVTLPQVCQFYSIYVMPVACVNSQGVVDSCPPDFTLLGEPVFTGTGATLECLDKLIEGALSFPFQIAQTGLASRGLPVPASLWEFEQYFTVNAAAMGELMKLRQAGMPWELESFLSQIDDDLLFYFKNLFQADWASGEGALLMDADCKPVAPGAGQVCGDLNVRAVVSPISLIWQQGYDIGRESTVVPFPLRPGAEKAWYVWKASAQAPLLVYDPHGRGTVESGAQLFGSYTFGAKSASLIPGALGEVVEQPIWENGYQALATLDLDGDGKLSGDELSPLAMWFDENRNGRAEPGELRTLKEGVRPVKTTLDGACEPSAQADRTSVRGQNSPHRGSADPQPSRALRVAEPLSLQRSRPLLPLM